MNEAILERATAKLEALSEHFEKMVKEVPTREDLHSLWEEARVTRRLLHDKIEHDIEDRRALNLRLDAMMTMMGNVLARLPEPTKESREADTGPLPPNNT